eukprot:3834921-Pyramimonas_sp.AAC.1
MRSITLPVLSSWSTTALAASIGMAKETPSAASAFILFTPITRPSRSTSGPPELPWRRVRGGAEGGHRRVRGVGSSANLRPPADPRSCPGRGSEGGQRGGI